MQINWQSHLDDYARYLKGENIACGHHHLLLACMPKSGSTWLSAVLSCLPGFQSVSLVNGWDRREQELCDIRLLLNHRLNYVAQQHIRYSEPTAHRIQRFSLKPIVLMRNIFDIVPSLRDHARRESVRGAAGYLQPEMTAWTSERIERCIVDMVLPWYFNFFLCWRECKDKLVITYEELQRSMRQVVYQICDCCEIPATEEQVDNAIVNASTRNTRKNVGSCGRGNSLSPAVVERIWAMAKHYPGVDFSPIGLSCSNRPTGAGNSNPHTRLADMSASD